MSEIVDARADERDLMQKVLAGQREAPVVALCKLFELRLLKCQNRMLDCVYDEFPALQAEAKILAKLVKELKIK